MPKKKRKRGKQKRHKSPAIVLPEGYKLLRPDDTFSYQCSLCGDCCRNVRDAVMLESLDLYRLAKHFRESGQKDIDDIILEYTHTQFLGGIDYFPILLLNTSGADNACVFLKDNRCSVQSAKPRACRLYPLSAGPNDYMSGFDYILVSQKPHHFTGPEIRTGDWMDANFSKEDREFVMRDIKATRELAPILMGLKQLGAGMDEVLKPFVFYKYLLYEPDEPFLPQFSRNMAVLKRVLSELLRRSADKNK